MTSWGARTLMNKFQDIHYNPTIPYSTLQYMPIMNILRTVMILKLVNNDLSYPFTKIMTAAKIMNMAVTTPILLQLLEFFCAQFLTPLSTNYKRPIVNFCL